MEKTVEIKCPRCEAREGFLMALLEEFGAEDMQYSMAITCEVAVRSGLIKRKGDTYAKWYKPGWFEEKKES